MLQHTLKCPIPALRRVAATGEGKGRAGAARGGAAGWGRGRGAAEGHGGGRRCLPAPARPAPPGSPRPPRRCRGEGGERPASGAANLEDAALVGRGPDPAAPRLGGRSSPRQPARPREFLLDGRRRAGGIPRTTCSWHLNHPHRRAESLPVVKLSVLYWGQVGRLVRSRRGFDFFRSKEAQKETLCSLKISGTTGKKQQHCASNKETISRLSKHAVELNFAAAFLNVPWDASNPRMPFQVQMLSRMKGSGKAMKDALGRSHH